MFTLALCHAESRQERWPLVKTQRGGQCHNPSKFSSMIAGSPFKPCPAKTGPWEDESVGKGSILRAPPTEA